MPPLSEAERAIRATGIGSSEIAAILGEDPMCSALDVWLRKTGRVPDDISIQAQMGTRFEGPIADTFAEKYQVELDRCTTVVHPQYPIAVATPDRRIRGRRTVVEAKQVGFRMMHKWRLLNGDYAAPPYVQLQGNWQCFVAGYEDFYIAAWIGGRDWYDEHFPGDPELGGYMLEAAAKFWRDHVVADVQPTADATERARLLLERVFPKSKGTLLPATGNVMSIARDYALARKAEKEARDRKNGFGNRLRQLIGDGDGFESESGRVTWISAAKGKTSWSALAKELNPSAELIAKHTGKPGRTLKVQVDGMDDDEDE